MWWTLRLIVLLGAAVTALASNSYIALIPKVLRPGLPLNVTVTVFNTEPGNPDVFVRAELVNKTDYKALAFADEVIHKNVPGTIQLNVPKNLISTGNYHVTIHGVGGLHFTNGADISFEEKHISIFIQTDKAVYKAGQTVHFRTFALHPNGTVSLNKMDIKIYDSRDNKVKQILGVRDPEYGVVNGSMIMDEKPALGQWKIKVSTEGYSYQKTFKVAEYVLPKYKVELDVPTYVLTTDRELSGTVTAKYTYGKTASGKMKVTAHFKDYTTPWKGPLFEQTMDIHGEARFTIPLDKLQEISSHYTLIGDEVVGKHLIVTAVVTEKLNNMTMNDSSSVEMRKSSLELKFPSTAKTSFIPGLTYTARVQLAEADGRPPMGHLQPLQFTVYTKYSHGFTSDWPGVKIVTFFDKSYTVPPTGLLNIDLELPKNATQVKLMAKYGAMEKHMYVTPLIDSYIHSQLNLISTKHVAGGKASFRLKTTRPLNGTFYQVLSRGNAVKTGYINLQNNLTAYFDIEITPNMAPISKVILYYLEEQSGQIFADSATINVDGTLQNKVSLQFNATTAQPGDHIYLDVTADPNSMVNLLAVDQSVMLLGSGNDLSESEVINELGGYTPAAAPNLYFYHPHNHKYGSSMTHNKLYPGYRFDESGTLVLTDALNYDHVSYNYKSSYESYPYKRSSTRLNHYRQLLARQAGCVCPGFGVQPTVQYSTDKFGNPIAVPHAGEAGIPTAQPVTDKFGYPIAIPTGWYSGQPTAQPLTDKNGNPLAISTAGSVQPLKKVEKIRSQFPETWLWVNKTTGSDGHARFSAKTPDTITSWIASAFAINKDSGLGLSSSSAKLKVFRPFFISLNLPYSVVRDEEVVIQVNIFNYLSQDMNVLVTLEKNEDFKNIIVKDDSGKQLHTTPQTVKVFYHGKRALSYESRIETQTVMVKGGEAASVYFPIVPTKLGKIDVSVKAQSSLAADGVKRKLLVEPEGVPKDYNVPVIIDLMKNDSFTKLINITFPSSVVAGSERVRIMAIGDFMGPSITGLDSLLRMPTGCGEQTMVGFAPDVFISNYLKTSGQLEDSIKDKALRYMQKGYQRELTFQHRDGSFSVFGESDYSGSMWLTSFVVKSFHQAKKHVLIDDSTILKALNWILHRQQVDGSFPEPGSVHSGRLKGGSGTGISLTAFVTIALVENKDLDKAMSGRLQSSLNAARSYLESKLPTITDTYTLAIISYALALTGSNSSKAAYNNLDSTAVIVNETKHWKVNPYKYYSYWYPPEQQATAIDIEATSYALLYNAHNKDYISGLPILKWILKQRNPYGGFASTQDTVLALQALSEFTEMGFLGGSGNDPSGLKMAIDINGDTMTHQFTINKQNALVLQSTEPKPVPTFVNISATGSGIGLVEVSAFFNVEQELKQPKFSMNVTLLEEKLNRLTLRTCTRYLMTGESGMTVLELGIPTGFELEAESVIEVSTLKKTETVDRKVIFYFDKITQAETCLTLSVTRIDLVAKSKPVPVRVYDYYSPDDQVTAFYQSNLLKDSSYCDVCTECNCPP